MTERLTGGISPEAQEALQKLTLAVISDTPVKPPEARISLKDRPYTDILERQPELEKAIINTMDQLTKADLEVPVFHITSRAVRFPDGVEQSTGYLENIAKKGFRARDTNVAALIKRDDAADIANSRYFAANPHRFLRALGESLSHYSHHGSRTNKETLGEHRDTGIGLPTMLIIDASGTLIPGSDYEDHFMLGETVSPKHIVGSIDLYGRRSINPDDVAAIAKEYLGRTAQYVDSSRD